MSDEPKDDFQLGGIAPPLTPNASLEAEEQAMRGGRTGLIVMMSAIALLLVGGFIALLMGDDTDPYETFGRNLNGLKAQKFDSFWDCAFQANEEVRSNEDLLRELNERAARGKARFGEYVRNDCFEKLAQLEVGLRALLPPDEMRPQLNELITSVENLRGAWSDYLAYLDTLEDVYDEDAASSKTRPIARGWYEYKHAHSALNTAIREQLQ